MAPWLQNIHWGFQLMFRPCFSSSFSNLCRISCSFLFFCICYEQSIIWMSHVKNMAAKKGIILGLLIFSELLHCISWVFRRENTSFSDPILFFRKIHNQARQYVLWAASFQDLRESISPQVSFSKQHLNNYYLSLSGILHPLTKKSYERIVDAVSSSYVEYVL